MPPRPFVRFLRSRTKAVNFGGAALVQRIAASGLVDEASIADALSSSANLLNASISTFAQAEIRLLQGQDIVFTVQFLDKPKGYGSLFLPDGCVTPVSWKPAE